MASFLEDLYNKLFSSLSRSASPLPTQDTSFFLATTTDITSYRSEMSSPPSSVNESAIADTSPSSFSSDASSAFFPRAPRTSVSSTNSSNSFLTQSDISKPFADPALQVCPMRREYIKPTDEMDFDELLARKPQKWSLGHYVKNARDVKKPVKTPAQEAQAFQDTKAELLRAKEELQRLAGKRT